tara:strand:+ start:16090 stop:17751 length:1662 start_codon:yes stop_codon:yes gene_type:complete
MGSAEYDGGSTVNAPRKVDIQGQPHQLSYITPKEAGILKALGGAGKPGPMGIPSFYDEGDDYTGPGGDSFADASGGQTTNISSSDMYSGGSNNFNNDSDDDNQPVSQENFNKAQGITATNPYGNQGFFSRVFGIDPSKISYTNLMSKDQINKIASNQYSKYRNPFNDPNQPAYNPSFASGDMNSGILRSGVSTGQTVIDPRTGQETTVESFRQPMSGMDTAASLALTAGLPIAGSALADIGSRVKGLEGQPPTIDGQQATERGSSLLSGILGPGVEKISGSRLLDQVMQTASDIFKQPQQAEALNTQIRASNKNQADQLIRDTIRNTARPSAAPVDVRMERRPLTVQDPLSAVPSQLQIDNNPIDQDSGIMDALMGGVRDGVNPPQVSGLANIPTEQVADASTSEFLNRGAVNTLNDIFQAYKKGPPPVQVGPGQLKLSVDPFGEEKSIGGQFTMPVQDFGLGGLLSQNQAQQSPDQAFQVADSSNPYISGNVRRGRLKNQGGGFFGAKGSSGRIYTGSGTSGYSRSKSKGDSSFLDKLGQMFSLNPYDSLNS